MDTEHFLQLYIIQRLKYEERTYVRFTLFRHGVDSSVGALTCNQESPCTSGRTPKRILSEINRNFPASLLSEIFSEAAFTKRLLVSPQNYNLASMFSVRYAPLSLSLSLHFRSFYFVSSPTFCLLDTAYTLSRVYAPISL